MRSLSKELFVETNVPDEDMEAFFLRHAYEMDVTEKVLIILMTMIREFSISSNDKELLKKEVLQALESYLDAVLDDDEYVAREFEMNSNVVRLKR